MIIHVMLVIMKTPQLLFFTVVVLLISCSNPQQPELMVEMDLMQLPPPPTAPLPPLLPEFVADTLPIVEEEEGKPHSTPKGDKARAVVKRIIKDGRMSICASDLQTTKLQLDSLIREVNGYYEKEEFEDGSDLISYQLKVRVPSSRFEALIARIERGKYEVRSKSIESREVTEEYSDLETRLASKRNTRKRYHELLSRSTSVKDILAVEEATHTLQEEIESTEGRLRYLADQVTFSTLDLTVFYEKGFMYKPQKQNEYAERVKKALDDGWKLVIDSLLWIVSVWPLLIMAPLVVWGLKRIKYIRGRAK